MRTTKVDECLRLLCSLGLPIGDVFDVGVLAGTPVLMKQFPDRTHHLFEPIDDHFADIRRNYAAIDHRLVHAAVTDKAGEVLIHAARKMDDGKISHGWITDQPGDATRTVRAITLDDYVVGALARSPYLLKIDVDGAPVPAAILRGAHAMLQDCSVVLIEMTVDRFFERAALLDSAGFDLWDLSALCYYGDCLWQFDAVYVNRRYKRQIPSLAPMHQHPFVPARWQSG
jgi:FkbM family methyltransferase